MVLLLMLVGEQSSIAGGEREITTSHNMRDMTRMAAAWYGTGIGIGSNSGGGSKMMTAQKATAAAAETVTATISRGGGVGYLLGQESLMMWAVGEVTSQPTVGGRGRFWGEVRARYGIRNVSAFCAFTFILFLDRIMWAYAWLERRHISPPWEDKDNFWGEVRARYGIKNVSVFCAFALVLPLARCCCCLWAMGVLALLSHCLLT